MSAELKRRQVFDGHEIRFCVVGEAGGIDYHVWKDSDGVTWNSGLEIHSRKPLYEHSPGGERCWLLGGPCWHDGSTRIAREWWNPVFEACNRDGDMEPLWLKLEYEYRSRFAPKDRDESQNRKKT